MGKKQKQKKQAKGKRQKRREKRSEFLYSKTKTKIMDIMSSISNRMLLSVLFVLRKSKKNDDNNDNDNVHQHQHQKHSSSSTSLFLRVVKITIGIIFISFLILFLLSFGIGRVPLHWFGYQGASHAGPDSVYLPGGGFSGFWFHLGYLHSIPSESLHEHDYYCYSAGCLGTLLYYTRYYLLL